MPIIVTELHIADAVARARARLERADRRLAAALCAGRSGLAWLALGAIAVAGGFAALVGVLPPPEASPVVSGGLLAIGGALLGIGVPMWRRARVEKRQRTREWRHALEMLCLREQQAEDNPGLTVEVLDGVDAEHPLLESKWQAGIAVPARYVQ